MSLETTIAALRSEMAIVQAKLDRLANTAFSDPIDSAVARARTESLTNEMDRLARRVMSAEDDLAHQTLQG